MVRVVIFDTPSRDGEQAVRTSLDLQKKREMAEQLDRLGVAPLRMLL